MVYLAGKPGLPILNQEIAVRLDLPGSYLSKILTDLANAHLIESFRGRLGGFCLRPEGLNTTLMDILLLTEGPMFAKSCLLGLKECSSETACPLHVRLSATKHELMELFEQTTLAQLARTVKFSGSVGSSCRASHNQATPRFEP